jgi:GNAT superfamily N-acetyltransferase
MAIEIDAFDTLFAAGGVFGEASSSTDGELAAYVHHGILLVAVDGNDRPIGYAGSNFVEDGLHVAEIDVARQWQRRGVGRALMQAVLAEASRRGLRSVTLTTDRLVPFNAPFYASLGFRIIEERALPDRLRTVLAEEHAAGFDRDRRVAMSIDLSSEAALSAGGGQ